MWAKLKSAGLSVLIYVVVSFGALFVFTLVLSVIIRPVTNFCVYEFPKAKWPYAFKYGTNGNHVHVSPTPADCDFLHAPVGFKGCHYEKSVQVMLYGTDVKTHQPIISYDEGKTWNWLPAGHQAELNEVYVGWDRVADTR